MAILPASWYRDSFPAASQSDDWVDRIVTQGHANYCIQYGHADGGGYGSLDLCARCGDPLPTMPDTYCDYCRSTSPCNHLNRRAYV